MKEQKEQRYFIKLPISDNFNNFLYLNLRLDDCELFFYNNEPFDGIQKRFTQSEINELQKDERMRNLDLNALKIKVQDDKFGGLI